MAVSKCPVTGCGSVSFETRDLVVHNFPMGLTAVQCSSCGAVIGTHERVALGPAVSNVHADVHKLQQQVATLAAALSQLSR